MASARRGRGADRRRDLVVIGGGTAGLISALVAAGVGARVTLIEAKRTGGDCLWTGCVPSKSLLAAADLAHRIRHADRVGLTPREPDIDFSKVMAHVTEARRVIAPQDSPQRLAREGIEVISGHARFTGPGEVSVDGRTVTFRKAVIATGSEPQLPAIPGLAGVDPLTSDSVWELSERPDRLAILGGGAIGCELAQAFARLGSTVILIESAPQLLSREEPAAGALIAEHLRADGVDVRCGARVEAVSAGRLSLPDGEIAFDRLLAATGRRPVTQDLGLDAAGVRTDARGAIEVDPRLRSSARHIYAAGDVTGAMAFTHVAAYHARVATVNALFGSRTTVDYAAVPRVVYTDPNVAAVGISEAEARARWPEPVIERFDYSELDRAITDGRRYGFVTLIGDPKGVLVGATVAAPEAGESIAELAAWTSIGAKIDQISQTVHAYPTFSEGPSRAADAHLRARYARPVSRRVTEAALAVLRQLDRPR
jgi:pyruvate/2-oxoglutarate dehydrogenase complex dihydrolipoamide dehydrogenase (E3) component